MLSTIPFETYIVVADVEGESISLLPFGHDVDPGNPHVLATKEIVGQY